MDFISDWIRYCTALVQPRPRERLLEDQRRPYVMEEAGDALAALAGQDERRSRASLALLMCLSNILTPPHVDGLILGRDVH